VRNPHYWDAAKVKLNGIRFLPIESLPVEETAFRGGQLHITDAVPSNRIASLIAERDPALRISPYMGSYFYALNTAHPPLDNPKVRLALSLAIDRDAIAGHLLGGAQLPAASLVPQGLAHYTPPTLCKRNAERARALLAEAGFPGGAGFPKLELLFNTSENHRMIAEAVQDMWRKELGIEITLRNEDFNSYIASRSARRHDILRMGWVADYPAAASFLENWRSGAANNFACWQNPTYDALMDKASEGGSADTIAQNYAAAESLLLENAVVIPVYHYNTVRLISPAVKGWEPNLMDWHPWKYVSIDAPAAK
jgi:oligopeptide transport system substrate-binding protein